MEDSSKRKSLSAANSRAPEPQQLELFQSTTGKNETGTTLNPHGIADVASTAATEIDKAEVFDQRKVDADQHVQEDQSLAVLIEFAKFIADTTVITLAAEDVNEFNVLADRVRSVINQKS